MSRLAPVALMVLAATLWFPGMSRSDTPHFTRCSVSIVNGTVFLEGQIAGLGNQVKPPPGTPLTLDALATAVCVDVTTDPPTVLGSTPVTKTVTFPPKNGNRVYAFTLDTPLVLPCDPPAEVVFAGVVVTDVTHGIRCPEPLLE